MNPLPNLADDPGYGDDRVYRAAVRELLRQVHLLQPVDRKAARLREYLDALEAFERRDGDLLGDALSGSPGSPETNEGDHEG